ncbi:MAG: response regulator transcription factor [Candidatus Aminicenantes bacterium]|jgi:DNA-binding response OmpR family regulator|nr:response regulator transcription factor [Candidatus Aminicenantes bacterium]
MKEKILIIEDEEELVKGLKLNLVFEGYEVIWAMDGEEGLNKALKEAPDLILLDIMLPKKDGLDVCRELRQRNVTIPIVMLTAKGEEVDKVVGLEIGADDYITKPFSVRELMARVKAHLRRGKKEEKSVPSVYRFNDVEIDFIHFKVKRSGIEFDLTSLEVEILKYFVAHRGEVVTRDTLLDKIWGYESYPSTRTIDNHILKLRKKLEEDPAQAKYIFSVYGEGYRFMGGL